MKVNGLSALDRLGRDEYCRCIVHTCMYVTIRFNFHWFEIGKLYAIVRSEHVSVMRKSSQPDQQIKLLANKWSHAKRDACGQSSRTIIRLCGTSQVKTVCKIEQGSTTMASPNSSYNSYHILCYFKIGFRKNSTEMKATGLVWERKCAINLACLRCIVSTGRRSRSWLFS